MKMIFIYSTFPNRQSAKKLTNKLLEKKLVACANMFPIQSSYVWNQKKVQNKEWAVLYKTKKKLFTKVENQIEKLHPYKVPAIIEIPLGRINNQYNIWLETCLVNNKKDI